MEKCMDFVERLGPDPASDVLLCVADPADLVRVSAVSRSWKNFVIANGFCKNLCLRMCPELSVFAHVEISNSAESTKENLEREHKAYSYLSHYIVSPLGKRDCIVEAIGASSTDNDLDENIINTLEPRDRADTGPSYWSSKGSNDPTVFEALTYRLKSNLCVVSEIRIQPFRAFFQYGNPVYSSSAVRFRMGYSRLSQDKMIPARDEYSAGQQYPDDMFIWTYISTEFPMTQENKLQSFKLPRPVICTGGIVRIEFLGRVQKQEMDDLYYICVCHVQVIGRPISPVFDIGIAEHGPVLKYFPKARNLPEQSKMASKEEARKSGWRTLATRMGRLSKPWNRMLLGPFRSALHFPEDRDQPP